MNAKEYLGQVRTIQAKIERKLEEIGMLRTMVESTTAPLGRDYISKSANQDKFANIISRIVDLETEIEDLVAQKFDIICAIEKIEDTIAFKAIYFKFVNGMRTTEICEKLEIAETTFYHKISVGYKEIENLQKNTEKSK